MTYNSFSFFVLLVFLMILYFSVPKKARYVVLLFFSQVFIWFAGGKSSVVFICGTAVFTYVLGRLIVREKSLGIQKTLLAIGVLGVLGVLFVFKYKTYFSFLPSRVLSVSIPIGISFYSLQVISYLIDIYRKEIDAERNILKYMLYVTWFPHILQGPIARFGQLSQTLFEGIGFSYDRFCKGLQLVIWGLAQKMIIADRAAIVVNEVFANGSRYGSVQVIYAAILYGIELYADFGGCVNISIGVSRIFGVQLADNFRQPYFATSVQDFWRRWHISLSSWLKDYVYIPLGGNRKGTVKKYVNLMITFLISGMWHGVGNHFIVWGGLHGFYQVLGSIVRPYKKRLQRLCHVREDSRLLHAFQVIITFILVDVAWVFFRAESISQACGLLQIAATKWNLWSLWNDDLYLLGIDRKETWLMIIFIVIMFVVDYWHEKKIAIRDTIAGYSIVVRWTIYLAILMAVILFGKYGYGFNAADFIYMNF